MSDTMNNKTDVNSLKYEVFKDNIFSKKGLFKYLRSISEIEDIKKDMKCILNKCNSNIDNLDLIRESRIIHESKQNYNTLNGMFFSIVISCYPIVLDIAYKGVNNISYYTLIFIGFLMAIIYVCIMYFHYKKPDEKRAAAYFWLETEMERKITMYNEQKRLEEENKK